MKIELHDYDIYPKVFPVGVSAEITVRPQGVHAAFSGEYKIMVQRLDSGSINFDFSAWNRTDYEVSPCDDGCLRFRYTADNEGELTVRIYKKDSEQRIVQLNLYALDADLAERIPLRGDLHIHTCRSDGHSDPAIVCADYRMKGYDFLVITDHGWYGPSLEAIRAYKDVHTALNILPGEEVHLPQTDVHIVNAGGLFSVNALAYGGDINGIRYDASIPAPEIVPAEQYDRELEEIEAALEDVPAGVNLRWYAVCVWAYRKIREADGLCIFAHPYWIEDMYNVPEPLTKYMLETGPFDAFEVLGGERYYQQNGFQTAIYYDEYRRGNVLPIVGSTDSHNSTENSPKSAICSTIVFAHRNERRDILQSIRDKYSVAVDTISAEYRLVGEYRFQKYACFLMENFYPLHDRAALTDGEVMRKYYLGEADASVVEATAALAEKMFDKYFLLA